MMKPLGLREIFEDSFQFPVIYFPPISVMDAKPRSCDEFCREEFKMGKPKKRKGKS